MGGSKVKTMINSPKLMMQGCNQKYLVRNIWISIQLITMMPEYREQPQAQCIFLYILMRPGHFHFGFVSNAQKINNGKIPFIKNNTSPGIK